MGMWNRFKLISFMLPGVGIDYDDGIFFINVGKTLKYSFGRKTI